MELQLAAHERFVFAVNTVWVTVALPGQRDASSRIASKMFGAAGSRMALLFLVRKIAAIVVVVADPHKRNALVVVALELVRWAGGRRTVQLVLSQRTIDNLVTTHR